MTNPLNTEDTVEPQDQPKPTAKQMRYLRDLANRLGQTFTYPKTRRQAAAEIDRLKKASRGRERFLDRDTARRETRAVRDAVAGGFPDDAAVTRGEVQGHGSSATWSRVR